MGEVPGADLRAVDRTLAVGGLRVRLLRAADEGRLFMDATVMLQKEVADRLVAAPGSPDYGGLAIQVTDLKARMFGDTSVVTGRGTPKEGEKRELRFTVVFAKRGEAWQMVAGHLSAVPN